MLEGEGPRETTLLTLRIDGIGNGKAVSMSEQGCVPDLIVRVSDWPHGLRCGECCRVMHEGEPYNERLTGMVDEVPAYMIVCRPCDEGRHTTTAG